MGITIYLVRIRYFAFCYFFICCSLSLWFLWLASTANILNLTVIVIVIIYLFIYLFILICTISALVLFYILISIFSCSYVKYCLFIGYRQNGRWAWKWCEIVSGLVIFKVFVYFYLFVSWASIFYLACSQYGVRVGDSKHAGFEVTSAIYSAFCRTIRTRLEVLTAVQSFSKQWYYFRIQSFQFKQAN